MVLSCFPPLASVLVFVTGRGRERFHSPGPALTPCRGAIFPVIPTRPLHSVPGRGPICYHPFLTGAVWGMGGAGASAGTWAGNAEKDTLPQAVEWGRTGRRAGGPRFLGPCPPPNELYSVRKSCCWHWAGSELII